MYQVLYVKEKPFQFAEIDNSKPIDLANISSAQGVFLTSSEIVLGRMLDSRDISCLFFGGPLEDIRNKRKELVTAGFETMFRLNPSKAILLPSDIDPNYREGIKARVRESKTKIVGFDRRSVNPSYIIRWI